MRLAGIFTSSALLCLLVLVASLAATVSGTLPEAVSQPTPPAADDSAARELLPGQPLTAQLSRETPHTYRLNALPGQYVSILITKHDLNLQLTVKEPGGQTLGEFVSWRYGPLRASFVVAAQGAHLLEVRSLESDAPEREYGIRLEEMRAATERDRRDADAMKAYAQAEKLRSDWSGDSLRAAIERYAEASDKWKSSASPRQAASALLDAGDTFFALGQYRSALDCYHRALRLSRSAGDERGAMQALNNAGYVHANMDDTARALSYFRQALRFYRRARPGATPIEDLRGTAQVVNNMGEAFYYRGDLLKAKEYFNRALEIYAGAIDRRGQALAHLNLSYTYMDAGDLYNSQAHLGVALALWRAVNDKRGEAQFNIAHGLLLSFRGEKQNAFDAYRSATQLFRATGDRQGEAAALNSIGKAYEDLNEPQIALDHYTLALKLFQESGNRDAEAVTMYYIGRVHRSLKDNEQALRYYDECLSLSRTLGKRRIENYALTDIASIYADKGQRQQALNSYGKVLRFYRGLKDRRGYAHVLSSIADVHFSSAEHAQALRFYRQALALSRAAGDHMNEAATLYKIARAERDGGDIEQALADVRAALQISETLRAKVASRDLRSSYFASAHEQYLLYINLLMRLHERRPSEGFDALALQASESARARTLLEILAEAHLDIRQGVDPRLLEREQALQQSLAEKAESHVLLRTEGGHEKEAGELEKEIRRLTTEYQEVTAEIREQGLRNATIVQTQPVRLDEIRNELLDDDTLLLEYVLGEEKSYLWAVTKTSFNSFELPPRSEIENVAREVYRLLTAYESETQDTFDSAGGAGSLDERYWRTAAVMSRMLLGRVASQLGRKRLLIVADGALQYLPFDALPVPATSTTDALPGDAGGANGGGANGAGEGDDAPAPLMLEHEIVTLPSATTLASLRRRGARPEAAPGKLVVALADPVFEADDPRFQRREFASGAARAEPIGAVQLRAALRSVGEAGGDSNLTRLPFTLQEAKAIMEVTPRGEGQMVSGFEASRALAVGGGLDQYRIVHLATHGVIDCQHPELSGIVLSMLNEKGERENGFLQLHDIYEMRLSAELVVLSACSTGLGKDIRGEGLVGLTQGFLHGGAQSVVASLWRVNDRATAELMRHFYRAMLKDGLPPSAALTDAKRALWREKRWRSPYYWAAFVLQGEYRQSIKAEAGSRGSAPMAFAIMILLLSLLSIGTLLAVAKRHRVRAS